MTFQTAAHKAAQTNLAKFIEAARSAIPFGPIQWEAVCWEVPNKARASSGRKVERLWFNANFTKKTTLSNVLPFPEPFASFVKAFVCHRESRRENGLATLDHMVAIRALRYLFSVLQDRADTPIAFIHADFDNAINLCLRKEQHSSAYRIGGKLAEIAEVIDQQRLVPIRIEWQNSVPRNNDAGGTFHSRVGHAFTEHRMRKLPSDAVLQALAEIANRADLEDRDLLRQRAIDLLVCGGFRINELLTLPHDCWRAEEQLSESGQPLLDRHGRPTTRFGIRYIPEKGGHTETQTKWLPTVMQDVAMRALNDIQRITQPFREIAQFMADHPGRTLLPEPWHALPADALLSMEEIAMVVGLKSSVSGNAFASSSRLPFHKKPGKTQLIDALSKSDLESHLASLSALDNIFPQGQAHYRLHECLFVIGVNFIGSHRGTLNGTATLLTDGQISDYVVGRTMGYSIFARLNYTDEQGSPLKVTSHQFRHWLNTLANEGGLSQLEIARWMGRKDISQNAAYNHMTGVQLAASIHSKLQKGAVQGVIADTAVRIRNPQRRKEFIRSLTTTAHMTDFGICLHDWSALPCPKHAACNTCEDHLIEKGNPEHRERAAELKQDTEMLLQLAQEEKKEESYGVDNWLGHQQRTLARLEAILSLHDNPDITDGTLVHLGKMIARESELKG